MLIEVKNLTKVYDEGESATHALRGVSFTIEKGEFVAVVGPSGSGKSTLLHALSFLDRPSGGVYRFEGKAMDELTDKELAVIRNTKMGFVFQAFNLLARATVLENVALPLVYAGVNPKERTRRARSVIEKVGLSHRIDHFSNQLSGGEKQRVTIARAIVNKPAVIFADEPTGNLDSVSGQQVMEILEELQENGHTILLVTHETYTAEFAQRIIRLKDGKIEEDRSVAKRHFARDHAFRK